MTTGQVAIPPSPEPPVFPLAGMGRVGYAMSIILGSVGQILFLGAAFGGMTWSYAAAGGIAAFAEVTMVASGDKALENRAAGKAWKLLAAFGVSVSFLAGGMNYSHFAGKSASMAIMFGSASVIGYLMHIISGHADVASYLRDKKEREKALEAAAELAADAQRQVEEDRRAEVAAREAEARAAEAQAIAEAAKSAAEEAAARLAEADALRDDPVPAKRKRVTTPAKSKRAAKVSPAVVPEIGQGSTRQRMAAHLDNNADQALAGEITGGDLDRMFGTNNYGRGVLKTWRDKREQSTDAASAVGQ